MLRGIDDNTIIAGAYSDPSLGGVCPMLAAHRAGGRTDLSSFARCWDLYTDARRPRLVTRRELRTLRMFLEHSLEDVTNAPGTSLTDETMVDAAKRIRGERSEHRRNAVVADAIEASRERIPDRAPTGERDRTSELENEEGWAWIQPTRRYDTYRERLAAASEQLSEQRASELLEEGRERRERRRERTPA